MPVEQTLNLGSGRSLFVHQEGSGPDVVLIHGAMTTSHDWLLSPVFGELIKSHRVTVVDRPGHAHSRRPRFGTPREQADQIAQGLAQLRVTRASLLTVLAASLPLPWQSDIRTWWRSWF